MGASPGKGTVVNWPEAQGVEQSDGPRAHGQYVSHDAADAGGRALERLHRRGMVVRLHLEHHCQPAADVHCSGIFRPGLRQHPSNASLPLWGRVRVGAAEHPQQWPGVLVAAMLAPQRTKHPQFHGVGLAAEALHNQVILGAGEGNLVQNFLGNGHGSPVGCEIPSPSGGGLGWGCPRNTTTWAAGMGIR